MNLQTQTALQHVIERPKHLDLIVRGGKGVKYAKVCETLKMIDRTKTLCYDKVEFEREFGKTGINYMKVYLKDHGIKKPRCVVDEGKVYIWSNDEK